MELSDDSEEVALTILMAAIHKAMQLTLYQKELVRLVMQETGGHYNPVLVTALIQEELNTPL